MLFEQSRLRFLLLADSGNCLWQWTLLTLRQSATYRQEHGMICRDNLLPHTQNQALVEHRERACNISSSLLSQLWGSILGLNREASIKWRLFKAVGFSPLLGERAGDDLFPSSCYPDGEMQTDLRVPEGVIFLAASKRVFLFLNITYCSNKKQVCKARETTLSRHRGRCFTR